VTSHCVHVTEERDADETDELSADISQLSVAKLRLLEVGLMLFSVSVTVITRKRGNCECIAT